MVSRSGAGHALPARRPGLPPAGHPASEYHACPAPVLRYHASRALVPRYHASRARSAASRGRGEQRDGTRRNRASRPAPGLRRGRPWARLFSAERRALQWRPAPSVASVRLAGRVVPNARHGISAPRLGAARYAARCPHGAPPSRGAHGNCHTAPGIFPRYHSRRISPAALARRSDAGRLMDTAGVNHDAWQGMPCCRWVPLEWTRPGRDVRQRRWFGVLGRRSGRDECRRAGHGPYRDWRPSRCAT